MANSLATQQKKVGIATYLGSDAVRQNIENVVGREHTSTFITSVVSAVQTNPNLSTCTNQSIFSGALLGESLKLSPSPQLGQYYLVPYEDKKSGISQAQFQMGAKGYIQLAIRSGQYRKIVITSIKDGEVKGYNPITEEYLFEPCTDVSKREKLETIGYYGMFELVNGFKKEIFWTKEKMKTHAERYSKGYKNDIRKGTKYTFWSTNFDGMAEKTIIRQLISKWGIMSIEMQKAFANDMAVVNEDGSYEYVDGVSEQDMTIEEVKAEVEENANSVPFPEVVDAECEVIE